MRSPLAIAFAVALAGSSCTTPSPIVAPRIAPPPPRRFRAGDRAPVRTSTVEEPPPPALPLPPKPDLGAMRASFKPSPQAGTAPLIWPLEGVVISLFGHRDGHRHDGVDIGAPEGSAIWAAADGRVVFSGEQAGYGLMVILAHDSNLATVYAHNAANLVRSGDRVRQGDPIAQVGQSGGQTTPALHFEVRVNNEPVNPLAKLPE